MTVHQGARFRSCHRPTPAQLPGPPGFPRPPRGVLAIVGYPRPGDQLPHRLESVAPCPGVGTAPPQAEPAATRTSEGCCRLRLKRLVRSAFPTTSTGRARLSRAPRPVWLPTARQYCSSPSPPPHRREARCGSGWREPRNLVEPLEHFESASWIPPQRVSTGRAHLFGGSEGVSTGSKGGLCLRGGSSPHRACTRTDSGDHP
jgi:hypothetical protein